MQAKIKAFFLAHEQKTLLVVGFLLVACISFEAGMLKGAKTSQKPVIIEQNSAVSAGDQNQGADKNPSEAQNLAQGASGSTGNPVAPAQLTPGGKQDCAFLGSKSSTKYHLPTCQWAKRIKPENVVCFKDENDAKLKGYQPDKNCIK